MKIRNLLVILSVASIVIFNSCRDDFDFDLSSGNLSFSSDTIHLDTIFNQTNSQTYKLTVHNNQDEDVEIPRIFLSRGETSFFKLNVDGSPGSNFENVPIRKNDSIFIFIEIAAGDSPINPMYEDEINFETTSGNQQVKLLSYIEKAEFFNTDEIDGYSIGNQVWNDQTSKVLYGNITAEELTIGPRTKIYLHHDASLTVHQLTINGALQNEVKFRTDRMDERSDSLPNMWGKIHIKNSSNSLINYAIIKGGNIGLEIENSNLQISNTKILNHEKIGLYGHGNANSVTGKNLVINNSDQAAIKVEGGTYTFYQSTIANYFNIGQGTGDGWSLWLTGELSSNVNFYNSILYNQAFDAVAIDIGSANFSKCVINNGSNANFSGNNNYEDPLFVDPGFGKNDLRLKQDSPAFQQLGNNIESDVELYKDILEFNRNLLSPTPGAYEQPYVEEQ